MSGESSSTEPTRATLRYLRAGVERPIFFARADGGEAPQNPEDLEGRTVEIEDGRGHEFGVDTHGFALVRCESAVGGTFDADESAYGAEIEALVRSRTGADRTMVFDHTARATGGSARRQHGRARDPVWLVHNDYTDRSGRVRAQQLLPAELAAGLSSHRFAILNVWRPLSPVRQAPLALCDCSTVAPSDYVAATRLSPDREGEIQLARFDPRHRWLYFPDMDATEALVFKTFDSAADARARFTLHTAFEDPSAAADAPARESVESRVFAWWA